MQYYQEITLLPDTEIGLYFLWTKVYNQVHLALVNVKNVHHIDTIGISFPEYYYDNTDGKIAAKLGNKLRVFAQSEAELIKLDLVNWLKYFTDHVHIKPISAVGDKATGFITVKRYRFGNLQKTAKRFAQFKNISFDEALAHCKTYKRINGKYPFIRLRSLSTEQDYQIAICQEMVDRQVSGKFNIYGIGVKADLEKIPTVPHW